jgi:hypothetical protein
MSCPSTTIQNEQKQIVSLLLHHCTITVRNPKKFQPLNGQQLYDSSHYVTKYALHIKLNFYKWLLTYAARMYQLHSLKITL